MVTARFCQLDTADSDACQILGNKLGWPPELARNANLDEDDKNKRNKKRKGKGGNNGGADSLEDSELHCSICGADGCNGSPSISAWSWWCAGILPMLIAIVNILRHSVW